MQSAFLIIDVQTALCVGRDAVFEVDRVVDRINQAAAAARAAEMPVFVIQHDDSSDAFRYGSDGWQLYSRLVVAPGDILIRKTATDSFHRTDLQAQLQSRGVGHLIICGMQTEFCVDTTVRRALALGYPVTLIADGHSTINNGVLAAEQIVAHHNETLANIQSFGPRVTATPAHALEIPSRDRQ